MSLCIRFKLLVRNTSQLVRNPEESVLWKAERSLKPLREQFQICIKYFRSDRCANSLRILEPIYSKFATKTP